MKIETITLDESRNTYLRVYTQGEAGNFKYVNKRPGILIIPGGGYMHVSENEADPVAFAYLKAGYQVFILNYSVGEYRGWPMPLLDYDQAMGIIKERAEKFRVYEDKIAVVGFSAGGHLVAAAAVMAQNRPNAAILGYAVVNDDVKSVNPNAPSIPELVNKDTCPCFVFANRDDDIVPIQNSLDMLNALAKAQVSFESHIYSYGGHGFSTGERFITGPDKKYTERDLRWVEDSIHWLTEVFGDWGDNELKEPVLPKSLNGDNDEYLSARCSVGHVFAVEGGRAIIEPIFDSMRTPGTSVEESMTPTLLGMKLKDVLHFAGAPDEAIAQIDAQLRKVKNEVR